MEEKYWRKVKVEDLSYLANEIEGFSSPPYVLILTGALGSGKTAFAKTFCQFVMKDEEVTSPSYSLINDYGPILHGDLYRIEDRNELVHLELGQASEGKKYVLMEWGERYLEDLMAEIGDQFSYYQLTIKHSEQDKGRDYHFKHLPFQG